MCLVVEAASWPELCEQAALAFGAFVGGGTAQASLAAPAASTALVGADRDELWVRWWRALLRLWLVEARLAVDARVEASQDPHELRARALVVPLESLDPTRCVDVKGATWHGGRVERDGDTWRGRIVLDV